MSVRNDKDPTFAEFPERALKRYHEIGFHIEPGLVADEGCDRLIAAGMAINVGSAYSPIPLPHRLDETFLKAMRAPRIAEIVAAKVQGDNTRFFPFGKPRRLDVLEVVQIDA